MLGADSKHAFRSVPVLQLWGSPQSHCIGGLCLSMEDLLQGGRHELCNEVRSCPAAVVFAKDKFVWRGLAQAYGAACVCPGSRELE